MTIVSMGGKHVRLRGALMALTALVGLGLTVTASAVPSFAQQTGLPCEQCHTVAFGPALTAYGREFKLHGYVYGNDSSHVPLAVMALGGYTHTSEALPTRATYKYSDNNNTSLDQVSLFVATGITQHLGLFSQFTWVGSSHTTQWDNSDLRYALPFNLGPNAVVAGFSVNNNPTVQDLWNSTPAWGFPWINSALAPRPSPGPFITTLAQTVLGATAYAMLNDLVYVEAGGYRGLSNNWLDKTGVGHDASSNLSGPAPYWRAAVQWRQDAHYYSIGTFGINARVQPDPTLPQQDHYTDFGADATYQYSPVGPHGVALNANFIHEQQNLDFSAAHVNSDAARNYLQSASFDLTYAYRRSYAATINGFITSGTTNFERYAPAAVSGSGNGDPSSRGYTVEGEYIPFGKLNSPMRPWLNLRLGLQYIHYFKFNGGTVNYDGFGRSANANDTTFAYFWIIG